MKKRDIYLNQLIPYKDKPLIKVITGIRRCGKSTLLSLYEAYLLQQGVPQERIIRMNFESLLYDDINTYQQLYHYVQSKIANKADKYYLIFDEIQQVVAWEKAINSLLVDASVDIYLTGSNAYLLSSELATLLSGRYVEIKMQPLSFKEYLNFIDNSDATSREQHFESYLQFGGLPAIVELRDFPETIPGFLTGVYNTVIMKDIVQRNSVRDPALLESLLKFVASNVGSILSTKKISDYLTSCGRKTTSDTIDNYLRMLENAFIIYKANRYDLKGKLFLKTLEKYYIVDTGIRHQLTGLRNTDYGHILENVVYLELLRQGFDVSIGKIGTLEVDFIATKLDSKVYYQVCASIMDESTRERELKPLQSIEDNYEKVILTMDTVLYKDFDGIKVVNILDFLLS